MICGYNIFLHLWNPYWLACFSGSDIKREIKFGCEEDRAEASPEETMSCSFLALSNLEFQLYKLFSEAVKLQRQK